MHNKVNMHLPFNCPLHCPLFIAPGAQPGEHGLTALLDETAAWDGTVVGAPQQQGNGDGPTVLVGGIKVPQQVGPQGQAVVQHLTSQAPRDLSSGAALPSTASHPVSQGEQSWGVEVKQAVQPAEYCTRCLVWGLVLGLSACGKVSGGGGGLGWIQW